MTQNGATHYRVGPLHHLGAKKSALRLIMLAMRDLLKIQVIVIQASLFLPVPQAREVFSVVGDLAISSGN